MSYCPGSTLEDWVDGTYSGLTPDQRAAIIRDLEPAREYVEDVVIPGFDPETQSWRQYSSDHSGIVEAAAGRLRQEG